MGSDTLNENLFDMPDDIQEAERRIQRHNEGRRLANIRLMQINDGFASSCEPWTANQQACVCEAAVSQYDRERIYALEREREALQGTIVGLRYQLEQKVPEAKFSDEQMKDLEAALRVIKLMATQNERMQARREPDALTRLENALVSDMRQGLNVEAIRLGDPDGIDPKADYTR